MTRSATETPRRPQRHHEAHGVRRRTDRDIVPVEAAEPIIGRWRRQCDPSAAAGVPAHVTIIYPFLPERNLDEDVLCDVRRLVVHHRSFTVTFANCGHLPDVLFLVPDPDDPFRRLTADLFRRWPEAPPYAGLITDPVPHLTITHGASPWEASPNTSR
ncbi:MAG: 2'-5' RNA ligase family protein [Pseudonocardiaceae bacterium]